MQQLTPTQQQALEAFHKTGELGILSNILIEDCCNYLESFENWEDHSLQNLHYIGDNYWMNEFEEGNSFLDLPAGSKIYIIQTLLSQTPDGKAVMPFLDVETEEILHNHYNHIIRLDEEGNEYVDEQPIYITLDHHLYKEFTEALRTGKSFERALETITKIYITEIYV